MSASIDWKFTLEKSAAGGASQKDILKDPLGFKQDLTDVLLNGFIIKFKSSFDVNVRAA
jgi:hypothetical protein